MFGKQVFVDGLKQLGYAPEELGENRISFSYTIGAGRFEGRAISVGVDVPADFNVTCPTGPHISPHLIPMNPNGAANDRAATSNFGPEWQYLSRPFVDAKAGWDRTSREVKAYLWHVKRILETL
jgi:hypothetical protein